MLCYSALNLQGGQSKVPHGPLVLFLENELSPKRPSEKSFAAFLGVVWVSGQYLENSSRTERHVLGILRPWLCAYSGKKQQA